MCIRAVSAWLAAVDMLTLACVVPAAGAAPPEVMPRPDSQLVVLYDFTADPDFKFADDLAAALTDTKPTPAAARVSAALNVPVRARSLLTYRTPRELLVTLDKDDPERRLNEYVVLVYADASSARAAYARVKAAPFVRNVENPVVDIRFQAHPADPFHQVPVAPTDLNHQWGMYRIDTEPAWDMSRGFANVGHLDNGIQTVGGPVGGYNDDLWVAVRRYKFNAFTLTEITNIDENWGYGGLVLGHGTHTAGIIAANTFPPGVAAGYPGYGFPAKGVTGVCWWCGLMIGKVAAFGATGPDLSALGSATDWAAKSGAQVLNYSFATRASLSGAAGCSNPDFSSWCTALQVAANYDIVIVAAAGNDKLTSLPFPASDSRTIAVGGVQYSPGSRGYLWTEEPVIVPGLVGSATGPGMESRGVLAPAKNVISTVYGGYNWIAASCGDSALGSVMGDGYGPCTGTSMSAPHVTGIVGLMRSLNPLMSRAQIQQILLESADRALTPNWDFGFGTVKASSAVQGVWEQSSRLTPLFSFYSSAARDYFYTIWPQAARSAINGTLIPYQNGWSNFYSTTGNPVKEYSAFPSLGGNQPRAQAYVWTTHVNPWFPNDPTKELWPIYRMSRACGEGTGSCPTISHVDRAYTTVVSDKDYLFSIGYLFDGFEGYVYPANLAPQPGMVQLLRRYNPGRDDIAIFPSSELSAMQASGYTTIVNGLSVLGYVYPNSTATPDVSVQLTAQYGSVYPAQDILYTLKVAAESASANGVTATVSLPSGTSLVHASSGCVAIVGGVSCGYGTVPFKTTITRYVAVRYSGASGVNVTASASVSSTDGDSNSANNTSSATVFISSAQPAVATPLYRLYNPSIQRHLYTTDFNEYQVLAGLGWNQEGSIGKLLSTPAAPAGTAVPMYRMYAKNLLAHHWTTTSNEYYSAAIKPWVWNAENVVGYVYPGFVGGSIALYRLRRNDVGATLLTTDLNEYNVLTGTGLWAGLGVLGYLLP